MGEGRGRKMLRFCPLHYAGGAGVSPGLDSDPSSLCIYLPRPSPISFLFVTMPQYYALFRRFRK